MGRMPLALARRRPTSMIDESPGDPVTAAPAGRRTPRPWTEQESDRHRGVLAAAGALTVLLCTALGAAVATRTNDRHAYLAVARLVPEGDLLVGTDLRSVSVTPAPGLSALPVVDAGAVLGRRASTTLEPGTLLVASDLGGAAPLAAGAALVGTSLSPNQLPLGLQPGDEVLVLLGGPSVATEAAASAADTGAAGSTADTGAGGSTAGTPGSLGGASGVLARGVVTSIGAPGPGASGAGGGEDVTIDVPEGSAASVAAASAAGDVSLAEVGARSAA